MGGVKEENVKFLDIGCGSGAISLSLLQECPNVSDVLNIDGVLNY